MTLSAERGADCILQPKTGSEVLFKTTRMDFADLYRALERITPATGLEAVLDVVEANTDGPVQAGVAGVQAHGDFAVCLHGAHHTPS